MVPVTPSPLQGLCHMRLAGSTARSSELYPKVQGRTTRVLSISTTASRRFLERAIDSFPLQPLFLEQT